MSLINDALKKAQRQRTGPHDAPPMPGGAHGAARGGSGAPAQMLVLAIAGAVVVVVISVVATVFFLNRAPTAKPAPIVAVARPAAATPEASPVIIAPVIVQAPPPTTETPKPTETAGASPVTAAPVTTGPAAASPVTAAPVAAVPGAASPVAAAPIPSTTPAPAELPPLDVRIATFVENVKVTGILRSGTGSKVLMNDKVYKLGDVVDRVLSLRLIKIEADSLTFADINGTPYVKSL